MKGKLNLKNLIILMLVAFFAFNYVRQEKAMKRIANEVTQKEAELRELKLRTERLQDEVEKSNSDEYLEALARERLKMIKPGEKIVNEK